MKFTEEEKYFNKRDSYLQNQKRLPRKLKKRWKKWKKMYTAVFYFPSTENKEITIIQHKEGDPHKFRN